MDENIIKIKDFYDRRSNRWRSYQKKKKRDYLQISLSNQQACKDDELIEKG